MKALQSWAIFCGIIDLLSDPCRQETSAFFAHTAFVSLGLRHLCVVDERSHVRGIVTRRDLDAAAGHGAWRRNRMAPAPRPPDDKGKASYLQRMFSRATGSVLRTGGARA